MTSKRLMGVLLLILFIAINGVIAQTGRHFEAVRVDADQISDLKEYFTEYQLFRLPVDELDAWVQSEEYDYHLTLALPGLPVWNIALFPHEIKASGYRLRTSTGEIPSSKTISFRGHLGKGGDSDVRMVINNDYFSGMIKSGSTSWYMEPAYRMVEGVDRDLILVYEADKVIPKEGANCILLESEAFGRQQIEELKKEQDEERQGGEMAQAMMNCYEFEIATAHDKAMFDKYGSVSACESHAISVMNNVGTNWDDEFNDEIQFFITEQYVEQTNQNFPTGSLNATQVLMAFRNWGNGGGFNGNFDIGQLWTNRDFNGGTIGIAYLSAVCGSFRYHALQDFSNNASFLRVLVSHEIGHNFSCQHDAPGAPFIMAPSVNSSNDWSNASRNAVNGFAPGLGCSNSCSTAAPPVANFTSNVTTGCSPLTVQFTDLSSNSPTSWNWSFPGGTPSSSTQQNPTVTYNSAGSFNVSLTVTNGGGSDTRTISNYITVEESPIAAFSYVQNQLVVDFSNLSTAADLLTWDFGDGTSPITGAPGQNIPGGTHNGRTYGSFDFPTHEYLVDGNYTVELEASNNCGVDFFTELVQVVSPVSADFTSNIQSGCADLTVQFFSNASPNTTSWNWSFPGGSPTSSTEENPVVTYSNEGLFDVTLTVSNAQYSDMITRQDYVDVNDVPQAGFTYQVNNRTVNFNNTTINGGTLRWEFGDGQTSVQTSPTHTYAKDSIYTVMLISVNACGNDTIIQDIEVGMPPMASFSSNITEGCPVMTVQFQNLSSANATHFFWEFPGGSPATSILRAPVVNYANPGTYDVTLTAFNGVGSETVTLSDYIIVNPLPIAGFDADIDGRMVDFINLSQNGDSYLWNFGDGNTSSAESPSHTYALDGNYTVVLVVSNDCGDDSYTFNVNIATPPQASFTQDVTEGCLPVQVQFENTSSPNAVSFEWIFPGGQPSTSNAQDPLVTYDQVGTFDVTLIAFNNQGSDTMIMQDLIVINDVPEAEFSSQIDRQTVEFNNLSTRGDSYLWNFGDGEISNEISPVHDYQENGTYNVWLIVENECGLDSVMSTLEINAYPSAGFTSDTLSGCSPLLVQFTSQSSQADSLYWEFEGGSPSTSDQASPVVQYDQPGLYTVTLIAINDLGQDTLEVTNYIEIFPETVAEFSYTINGYIADFDNASENGTSFNWNFGDGATSTVASPMHEYQDPGSYTVTLIAEGVCGADTVSYALEIIDRTPAIRIATNANSGCTPLMIQFTDLSTNDPTSWSWAFEGGDPATSSDQNPLVTYRTPGIFRVTLEVSNQFGDSKAVYDSLITVLPDPLSEFTYLQNADTVQFVNQSENFDRIEWNFGDGNTSSEEDPMHVYEANGTYDAFLVVFNECGSDTFTVQIIVSVNGTKDPLGLGEFNLFPNPNTGQFTIRMVNTEINGNVTLQILDLMGRDIYTSELNAADLRDGSQVSLPMSGPGTYLVMLKQAEKISVTRMVIIQ